MVYLLGHLVNNMLYSYKNLLFLSLYRSHVINEVFHTGLMKTTAQMRNSYRPEFVLVSCNYPLVLQRCCKTS